jgi:4-amino-4-deoxy-L-arabinose transferase-like glycosyltransferase
MEPSNLPDISRLRWPHYLLLIACCTVIFGYVAISGRPLTLHEARLPQCSREMMASGNYLIPTSGGRPWLERPPLPHWIMIAVAKVIGQHCDKEWSVRIAPALCGMLIVLMIAAMTARWLGVGMGLAAGIMLATLYEFYYYSTLAEDDIFLALVVVAAMACFVRMEFFDDPRATDARLNPVGRRPWPVVAFFILLGCTNLAKGPIVGAAVLLGTIGAFLLLQRDWRRIRRYLWVWGIFVSVAIGLSWHVYVQRKFPEYWENLKYDFHETTDYDIPRYYYFYTILAVALPWSPLALLGLWTTFRAAWLKPESITKRSMVFRFLWCWAIVPILVLSIPHRGHHHYLVPSLAPWAILAAIGARPVVAHMFRGSPLTRRPIFGLLVYGLPISVVLVVLEAKHKIPGPFAPFVFLVVVWLICVWMFYYGLWNKRPAWLLAAMALGISSAFNWGQTYWPNDTMEDTRFLSYVELNIPRDKLVAINAAVGPLDFFRLQFYLPANAKLLHNLSYLRGSEIHSSDAYVVGRERDLVSLKTLGDARMIMESPHSHREMSNADHFSLFYLRFNADLQRFEPPPVSPMQAMLRKPGPWCGPALPELH